MAQKELNGAELYDIKKLGVDFKYAMGAVREIDPHLADVLMNAPVMSLDKQFAAFAPRQGEDPRTELIGACSRASHHISEFVRRVKESESMSKRLEMLAAFGASVRAGSSLLFEATPTEQGSPAHT